MEWTEKTKIFLKNVDPKKVCGDLLFGMIWKIKLSHFLENW